MNYFNSEKERDRASPKNNSNFRDERERESYLAFSNSPEYKSVESKARWQVYENYMRSREWKEKRKQALKRDDYKCRTCGAIEDGIYSTGDLEVHHRHYKDFTNESLDTLTTLCRECHHAITSVHRARRYGNREVPKSTPVPEPPKRSVPNTKRAELRTPNPIEETTRTVRENNYDVAATIRNTEKRSSNPSSQWTNQ